MFRKVAVLLLVRLDRHFVEERGVDTAVELVDVHALIRSPRRLCSAWRRRIASSCSRRSSVCRCRMLKTAHAR